MTTNHPNSLDSALIRPGRVDLQVTFTLATRDQIRDMYKRMYVNESSTGNGSIKHLTTNQPHTPRSGAGGDSVCFNPRSHIADSIEVQPEELSKMAEMFADKFPEEMFSPAEIQGFLLERKRYPERALIEVEKWRDEQLQLRAKGNGKKGALMS
jgi:chaperone BCS1